MTPFAGYDNFADCVSQNQDKQDPEAYCGKIKHQVEDALPKCVFTRMDCLEKKYPNIFTLKERLSMSYDFCYQHTDTQDFGNGNLFKYVEDLIGSDNLKEIITYKKLKEIWDVFATIGSPTLYDSENDIEYEGKICFKEVKADFVPLIHDYNMPLSPVSSSIVMARGVVDNKLYVRFHTSPENTYKYIFESNEKVLKACDEMTEESPGRWVWKNLRGHSKGEPTGIENVPEKYGKAQGSKRMVIGGEGSTGYQRHPYEKIGKVIQKIDEVPHMEELAKEMRKFKMGVKEEKAPREEKEKGELEAGGISGAPFRPEELRKYQRKIYEEKVKRKGAKEEAKAMLEKLRKKRTGDFEPKKEGRWVTIKGRKVFLPKGKKIHWKKEGKRKEMSAEAYKYNKAYLVAKYKKKYNLTIEEAEQLYREKQKTRAKKVQFQTSDLIVDDSMNELFEWVRKNTKATDDDEVKEIAFLISKSRIKKKERVYAGGEIREIKKTKEEQWKEVWEQIGSEFERRRKARKGKDFEELEEIIELIEELEQYDFYIDDHIEELTKYLQQEEEIENV